MSVKRNGFFTDGLLTIYYTPLQMGMGWLIFHTNTISMLFLLYTTATPLINSIKFIIHIFLKPIFKLRLQNNNHSITRGKIVSQHST